MMGTIQRRYLAAAATGAAGMQIQDNEIKIGAYSSLVFTRQSKHSQKLR